VPGLFVLVFAIGSALAGLAGVIGGFMWLTQPTLAHFVGPIVFVVVVVGGLGSLAGALIASMFIGILQTFAVAVDSSLLDLLSCVRGCRRSQVAVLRAVFDQGSRRRRRSCPTCCSC
jgi:branched-chain amino acid transport system permease protein